MDRRKFRLAHPRDVPGKEEAVWIQCGMGYENDKGQISILMTAIPINFDGKLWLFPQEEDEEGKPKPKKEAPEEPRKVTATGFTLPEGYVHKVHMRASDDKKSYLTWCNNRAKAQNLVDDWAKVTCKKCLREKENEPEEHEALGD